jgi:hypothetical protein
LGDPLQKIPLAVDDALRPAGTPKHHACGLSTPSSVGRQPFRAA